MAEVCNDLGQPIGAPLDVKMPAATPPQTAMIGQYCAVVPVDPTAHSAALYQAFCADSEARNWTYLPYGPFGTVQDFTQWMHTACTGDDPLFHTILDAAGTPVGLASYLRIDPAMGAIEVGNIHMSPHLQRTAASTEAMFLMMKRAFDELGYRRYEWKCDALNGPSRAAALRLGFTYEGTFRQAIHYKGRNRDTAWFAIIDKDWPRVCAAFEHWLAPDNFDANGQQRTALSARDTP